jgi:hypothetical protein
MAPSANGNNLMTTFAASVTIVDLPVGTTVSGLELFEAEPCACRSGSAKSGDQHDVLCD